MSNKLKVKWGSKATKKFMGRRVKIIRWLNPAEVEQLGWHYSAPVIIFDDDSYIIASRDDEGNDAGALFTSFEDLPVLPVI